MADAEAVRLLYVAATRARDHLVLSLFRGDRSERSAAAVIELGLGEVAPEMCSGLAGGGLRGRGDCRLRGRCD